MSVYNVSGTYQSIAAGTLQVRYITFFVLQPGTVTISGVNTGSNGNGDDARIYIFAADETSLTAVNAATFKGTAEVTFPAAGLYAVAISEEEFTEAEAETGRNADDDVPPFGYSVSFTEGSAVISTPRDAVVGTDAGEALYGSGSGEFMLGHGGNDGLFGEGGDDFIDGGAGDDGLAGGTGDDTIDGGAGNDDMRGLTGDDVLRGGAGADTIRGNEGRDNIEGGDGADEIYGDELSYLGLNDGGDLLSGGAGNDTIYGGGGTDTISGGADADTLWGGAGSDLLDGGDGDDFLGGAGEMFAPISNNSGDADTLLGGAGNDRIVMGYGDTVDGGEGTDELVIRVLADATEGVNLDLRQLANNGTITVGGASVTGIEYVIHVSLTDFDDAVIAGAIRPGVEGITIDGWGGNDQLTGTTGVDFIYGGDGDDIIRGNGGFNPATVPSGDRLSGENGNDTIYVGGNGATASGGRDNDRIFGSDGYDELYGDDGDDIIVGNGGSDGLNGGDGTDILDYSQEAGAGAVAVTLSSFESFVQSKAVDRSGETDFITGFEVIRATAGNDTFFMDFTSVRAEGGAGDDFFHAMGGFSTIVGGEGNDLLKVELHYSTAPVTIEMLTAGPAVDGLVPYSGRVVAGTHTSIAFEGIERFQIIGTRGNDTIITGVGADSISGGAGHDYLDGGAGADTMIGGVGDDVYVVDNASDTVTEKANEGIDQVRTARSSYFLATNVENLLGTSGLGQELRGNELGNWITGGSGDDALYGLDGNDVLEGGAGADVMYGGAGNDAYFVDNPGDQVIDDGGSGGLDLVVSTISFDLPVAVLDPFAGAAPLANPIRLNWIENLTFIGTASVDGTGNALANVLTGNSGANRLQGLDGNDTLDGGDGDDILEGGTGFNMLFGGAGNDVYVIENAGDLVVEHAGQGDADEVRTAVATYTLASEVEKLTGISGAGQQLFGNSLANIITGGTGDDLLTGGLGDDRIDGGDGDDVIAGGGGADTLSGGAGYDILDYGLDNSPQGVIVNLTAIQIGIVHSDSTQIALQPGQSLDGFGSIDTIAGFELIKGTARADTLRMGTGSVSVDAGEGSDFVSFGGGYANASGGGGFDTLNINVSAGSEAVSIHQGASGTGTVTSASMEIAFEQFERLSISSGSGDDMIVTGGGLDVINAGAGNDYLDGGAGADRLVGETGNDIYIVDDAGDVVVELAGEGDADEVRTALADYALPDHVEILTYTGTGTANLRGNAADNRLAGGTGADLFDLRDGGDDSASGGEGSDGFYMGAAFTAADRIDGGEGSDQVGLQGNYALLLGEDTLAGVETLALLSGTDTRFGASGTDLFSYALTTVDGNVAAGAVLKVNFNALVAGENVTFDGSAEQDGSFFLFAGKGVDDLTGGAQGDAFYFGPDGAFTTADRVDGGGGFDQVALRGNYDVALAGDEFANVETLALLSGKDTRFGAAGPDNNYVVAFADGNVAAGTQFVVNAQTLRAGESVAFDGSAESDGSFRFVGGAGDDTFTGSANADNIFGAGGADTLTGGAGADLFRYRSASESNAGATDIITDFVSGSDRIDLSLIDADTGAAGDQAFAFIGDAAFSGAAGELRVVQTAGGWTIEGDVDGDSAADLVIALTSPPPVVGDFVL